MQVPKQCPSCGEKLEFIADHELIPDTNPQEVGLEATCFECGTLVYMRFEMKAIEVIPLEEKE